MCVYGLKGGQTGNCVCGINDWTNSSVLETRVGLQESPLPNMICSSLLPCWVLGGLLTVM